MAIVTNKLKFKYNSNVGFKFPDLSLQKGERLLILGQSGKGKTTLLHLLAGILSPTSGSIKMDDVETTQMGRRSMDRFRGANIGLIFQRSYFVKSLTVKENLLLAQKLAGKPENMGQIRSVLQQMSILAKLNELPSNLSIGEQQRVSIGRAILNEPSLILADEPTSALDDTNADIVADLLDQTAKMCSANLIVVTHDHRLKNRFEKVITL